MTHCVVSLYWSLLLALRKFRHHCICITFPYCYLIKASSTFSTNRYFINVYWIACWRKEIWFFTSFCCSFRFNWFFGWWRCLTILRILRKLELFSSYWLLIKAWSWTLWQGLIIKWWKFWLLNLWFFGFLCCRFRIWFFTFFSFSRFERFFWLLWGLALIWELRKLKFFSSNGNVIKRMSRWWLNRYFVRIYCWL